jgi:hypothetical protein
VVSEPFDAWVLRVAWEHHRDRLAAALRVLRRRRPDEFDFDRIQADRAAAALDALDRLFEPTAGELVAAGHDVDEALALVDRHVAALHKRMGGKP